MILKDKRIIAIYLQIIKVDLHTNQMIMHSIKKNLQTKINLITIVKIDKEDKKFINNPIPLIHK